MQTQITIDTKNIFKRNRYLPSQQTTPVTFTKLKYNLNQTLRNKTSIFSVAMHKIAAIIHRSHNSIVFPFHAVCTRDFNRFKLARDNEC